MKRVNIKQIQSFYGMRVEILESQIEEYSQETDEYYKEQVIFLKGIIKGIREVTDALKFNYS